MRNKKLWQRVLVGAMTVTITVGTMGSMLSGCGNASNSASADASGNAIVAESADAASSEATGTGTAYKSETVYVTTDKAGTVNDITVSDWLQNTENYKTLTDTTSMSDVINVKGDEAIDQSGKDLNIDADGDDIYYQGSLDADTTLPVSLKITYELDGKTVSADELEGASGKVTIHIQYINNEKETVDGEEIYVPFIAATGMLLSNDHFSNVEVTNGKVVTNGNYQVVVGYGLPGMNDSLGLTGDYAQFTDTVDITADVTDYDVETMMTYVSSSALSDIDLDDADDLDTLKDSLNEMSDASAQLVSGSATLSDGADEINTNMKTLSDGVGTLASGLVSAQTGASKITDGANLLSQKLAQLNSSMSSMYDTIASSIDSYTTQAAQAQGVADKYQQAVDAYNNVVASGAATQLATISAAAQQLYTADATPNDSSQSAVCEKLEAAYSSAQTYEANAAQLKSAYDAYNTYLQNGDPTTAANYKTYADQYVTAVAAANTYYQGYCEGCKDYYSAVANQCTGAVTALQTIKGQMDAKDSTTGYDLQESLSALADAGVTLASGTSDLYNGITSAVDGSGTLAKGAVALSSGAQELADGAQTLEDGMGQFDEEAVQKLVDAFDGDIGNLTSNLQSVIDAGKDYKTFTSLKDGGDGEVKFIIKTE